MTTTVYETAYRSFEIREFKVSNLTSKSCTLIIPATSWNEEHTKRVALHSNYQDYWLTKKEAVDHLIKRAEGKIRVAKSEINQCEEALVKLKTEEV